MLQNIFYGLSLGAVYSLIAVGFALVFNILKFSNFSHGGVMSFTAYAGYLAFILLFKISDQALVGGIIGPFYLDQGFSKTEIAAISKASVQLVVSRTLRKP